MQLGDSLGKALPEARRRPAPEVRALGADTRRRGGGRLTRRRKDCGGSADEIALQRRRPGGGGACLPRAHSSALSVAALAGLNAFGRDVSTVREPGSNPGASVPRTSVAL